MNILIVGNGRGSWEMRGRQLGAALGATVTSAPTDEDWLQADLVVLVKRAGWAFAARAHARGIPIVWDALDFWRQPAENGLTDLAARARLATALREIRPTLMIGATKAMALAGDGAYLPHHGWEGLAATDARAEVQCVGYDGSPQYLDFWRPCLERECSARGWTFVVNPPDLSKMDMLVALRGGAWDGWICRQWKSGVKVGNAILAGRPLIAQPSAAVAELQPAGSVIESKRDLTKALDVWTDGARRAAVVPASRGRSVGFQRATIAESYRELLASVLKAGVTCR